MSKFILKNRPKKPEAPCYITHDVGNYVSLSHFNECVAKFKNENPGMNPGCIEIETDHCDYMGTKIILQCPPESFTDYEKKLEEYRVELKAYQMWRGKHTKQIEKAKADKKVEVAKRKLERTKDRLTKELADTEAKLEKA